MFTSRAEYRILLRQDDADFRLTSLGYELGLASERRYKLSIDKLEKRNAIIDGSKKILVKPDQINETLVKLNSSEIKQPIRVHDLLLRPEINISNIILEINEFGKLLDEGLGTTHDILESVEIAIKYAGYIDREKQIAEKIVRLEGIKISDDFDYSKFLSLSTEARQKLTRIKPSTIGQATRISGISPSDINVILVHLGR
jgi:tRNA uridine 5-carboxymethylaminomethyl modification enzyme